MTDYNTVIPLSERWGTRQEVEVYIEEDGRLLGSLAERMGRRTNVSISMPWNPIAAWPGPDNYRMESRIVVRRDDVRLRVCIEGAG